MDQNSAIRKRLPQEWDRLTNRIIGCAIEVHSNLGPGLLEKFYEEALVCELEQAGLKFSRQHLINMMYKGRPLGEYRLDLVVEQLVIVELKVVEKVLDVHEAQLLSYLRSANLPLGLLINYNHTRLVNGVTRRINDRCPLVRALPDLPPSPSPPSELSELNGISRIRP